MRQNLILSFTTFLLIIQLLTACLGSYLLTKWSLIYRRPVIRIFYWAITFICLLVTYFRRLIITNATSKYGDFAEVVVFLMNLTYVWSMGILIIIIVFGLMLFAKTLVTKIKKLNEKHRDKSTTAVVNESRRVFLKRTAAALPLLSFGLSSHSIFDGNHKIITTRHQLVIPSLPSEFDGFKIAQITDSHLGFYFGIDKLNRALELIKKENPHLLAITGDFIDELDLLEPALNLLNPFVGQLPYGAYFCWGNHEYFRDFNRIRRALDKSPITVLNNDNKLIIPGDNPLYLAGVDYPFYRTGENKENLRKNYLAKAMDGLPLNAVPILISHHSDFIEEAFAAGIPLTLAGHTHGGQAILFGKSLLPVPYKYMHGMYSHNDSLGYVSTGAGHWIPFRFNCPAEIAVFTLNAGSGAVAKRHWGENFLPVL